MKTKIVFVIILLSSRISLGQFSSENCLADMNGTLNHIHAVDLNGDNLKDILIIGKNIVWRKNLGNGDFQYQKFIEQSNNDITSGKPYDLDNDGDLDILANNNTGQIIWFENSGSGLFSSAILISPLAIFARDVSASDLDLDGDLDVLTASFSDNKIALYENLGNGNFGVQTTISTNAIGAEVVIAADVDNDGDFDVLSGSSTDNKIAWYENLGGLDFGVQTTITLAADGFTQGIAIFSEDLDNDGDLDVLSASSADDKIAWYENLGGGLFSSQIVLTSTADGARSIYSSDINGDGFKDILFTSIYNGNIGWFQNFGSGVFGTEQLIINSNSARKVITTDINFDGTQDVLASAGNKVHLLYNDGNANFSNELIVNDHGGNPTSISSVDLDGDGVKDILVSAKTYDRITWYKNYGNGVIGTERLLGDSLDLCLSTYPSDLDNDGDFDILFAAHNPDRIGWIQNFGNGNFSEPITISSFVDSPTAVYAADLNGDGLMDVLSSSWNDDKIAWYINLGSGNFSTQQIITTQTIKAEDVFAIDLDNDGDLDVISGCSWNDRVAWYENLGTGSFGPQIVLSNDFPVYSVHSADMDGDGDNEVLAARGGNIALFENLGGGNFGTEQVVASFPVTALSIYAKDLDGDSDLDLLYCTQQDDIVAWHENLGSLSFGPKQIITNSANAPTCVFAEDLDNDGDVEVMSTSDQDNEVSFYDNYLYFTTQIKGRIFIDINQNQIHDSLDLGLNQSAIFSTPISDYTFSYLDGNYFMNFSDIPATYLIQPTSLQYWSIVTDSLSYTIIIDSSFTAQDSLDFGFFPDTIVNELVPDLIGGYPKCNYDINYWINIENLGTTIPSGYIHLKLDDSIAYVSSEIPADSVSGQNFYWHFDSVFYFSDYLMNLQVHMPNFLSIGDTLISLLNIGIIDSLGNITYTSSDTLEQILTCAYDPNDKLVEPIGISPDGFIPLTQEFLDYTIRFQNTGNDTAEVVIITDQLDSELDWTTFFPLSSSHPVSISGDQNGVVTFTFNDIMLPDSNVNFLASQGFVKYRVGILPNLPVGTSITNTAEIYFDQNPPVITNTTINTLFDCNTLLQNTTFPSPICASSMAFGMIPDSTTTSQYYWNISGVDTLLGNELLWLADTTGTFNLNVKVENDFCIADTNTIITVYTDYSQFIDTTFICQGETTIIFGITQSFQGLYTDTLQTINGCDSVFLKQLTVHPIESIDLGSESIYCGDSLLIFGAYQSIPGIYQSVLQTTNGCDSIVTKELFVHQLPLTDLGVSEICFGDSLFLFSQYENYAGVYYDTLQNINGCDSILSQQLDVLPLPNVNFTALSQDTVCIYSGPITISGIPVGGNYSGNGVTSNQFNPSIAGQGTHYIYYNYTDVNGCSATDSAQVFVDVCLGIDPQTNYTISIYPNPFKDYTTIYFGQELTGNHSVYIYDLLGQVVYSVDNIKGNQLEIQRNKLNSGLYIFSLFDSTTGQEVYTTKLIVE